MTGDTEDEDLLLRQLQETVDSDPDNSSHHYNLGLFMWEKGEQRKGFKEKAVEHFVVSAKLNPNNGDAFRLLGHYYSRVSLDTQRALKCYQRAVTLNPDDFEAGEALCDLLDVEGKEILEVSVCREASEKSPRAFWAFRRLGYMQAHQKKWSEAVPALQHAIRGYPTCADLWEALGLAYQRLGMFTAAIKSYGRAIELEDSRVYALIESGNVLLMLGSFRKGVEHFRLALEISPCNLAAHFGLASALLGLSKECISFGAFGWGASLLEEASNVVSASTCLAGNIPSVWKLHGDIQITYAKCFPWMNEGQGLAIDDETFKASVLSWKRKCYLAAVSATNYYQRALHLAPWEANIYKDIAIAEDLICSFEGDKHDPVAWQLPEKMSLGGLLFEGNNSEFWVALGCLSRQSSLKQHAFIRGLQLDLSLAVAWAYLGKLYRKEDEKQLARQAFDRARSIDPSLSLPWAGMSIDTHPGGHTPDEAFESCLRAVQILPLAEFQIGLTKLAVLSGNLLTSQVYGAIQQAVQRAPYSPESHNLNGLACEARYDYLSAANSYRLARSVVRTISSTTKPKSLLVDISVNLARSLCWAGNASDAARECEDLNNAGQLDARGLHIYAISLWKLGKNDLALAIIRNLAAGVPNMEKSLGAASISLICKLLYCISGLGSAVTSILRMPRELMQSAKISYIVSVVHALDDSNRLEAVVSSAWSSLTSHGEIIEMHFLMAFIKLVRHGSGNVLGIQNGVYHLRKALHMYPNSNLLRNLLGYLLLCSKEWKDSHTATGCFIMDRLDCPSKKGFKSSYEIFGGAAVSCYSNGTCNHKFSFPTCKGRCENGAEVIKEMQKWLHQEPWNHNAKYLLVLVTHQKAREGRFPRHACFTIERLIHSALSNESYSETDISYQYKQFQLLLCASEISLQGRNYSSCVNHAKNASDLTLPDNYLFFAHLLLCRAYAAQGDFLNLQKEYVKCLQLKSNYQVGWICLKFLEVQYRLNIDSNIIDLNFEECLKETKGSSCMWTAIFDLVLAQISIWDQDFLGAEEALARALSVAGAESCLLLCHGAICMELCRQQCGSKFLSLAVSSLAKAQEISLIPLPIVSALIAQAEASLGDRANWERNLRREWSSWPPDMRPAELYFQMYLLSKQSKAGPNPSSRGESYQGPQRWILRAIHLNPSCSRYWKALLQES